MIKKLLIILVLFLSINVFSQTQTTKYINIQQNNWTRIIQINQNQFTYDFESLYSIYPSYIVTQTVEFTQQNGYLHKVWITSNTQINGLVRNIQIDKPQILFWNGQRWVNTFYLDWIIVGNVATQVHYFFYNYPTVQVQMQWLTIKIK